MLYVLVLTSSCLPKVCPLEDQSPYRRRIYFTNASATSRTIGVLPGTCVATLIRYCAYRPVLAIESPEATFRNGIQVASGVGVSPVRTSMAPFVPVGRSPVNNTVCHATDAPASQMRETWVRVAAYGVMRIQSTFSAPSPMPWSAMIGRIASVLSPSETACDATFT